MSKKNKDELFTVLRELWEAFPDMRFGQLVVNVSYFAREPSVEATWDVEDQEFLDAAKRLLSERTVESRGANEIENPGTPKSIGVAN